MKAVGSVRLENLAFWRPYLMTVATLINYMLDLTQEYEVISMAQLTAKLWLEKP